MNNDGLKSTNCLKYLCVIIDHKLNWTQHIAHVKNNVSKVIGICTELEVILQITA